jgi:ferredoxin
MGARFYGSSEPLFRVLPLRRELVADNACLDEDDVEAIIKKQTRIAVTPCFCRTSAQSSPKAAGCTHNPDFQETCLVFGVFADFYVENGNARKITVQEALAHIHQADEQGNIVEVLNTRDVEAMCSCCPCCCGVMKALMFFGGPSAKYASNYKARADQSQCTSCGKCKERCFMQAVALEEGLAAAIIDDKCVGCGLCVTICPANAITLHKKPEEAVYLPPTDGVIDLYDRITVLRRKTHEI